jgi:mRNA turnover protein 4
MSNFRSFFTNFTRPDFARDGNRALSTVRLEQGPLEQFSFSMEPQLRKLGLPTALDKGVVVLTTDYIVCEEGKPLTPEAAKVLVRFFQVLQRFFSPFRNCSTFK